MFLEDKEVVPKEQIDKYLREKIYDGTTPMTRDAAYHWLMKNTAGLSRANIERFLKKQRIIRETDNANPTTKRPARRVNTKGRLHVDLVEIKFKDLPFDPIVPKRTGWNKLSLEEKAEGDEEGDIVKGYFFGCVDSITSLAYYEWAAFKSHKIITPIAKKCFHFFSKQLSIPMNKLTVKSDMGAEFSWNTWRKWGVKPFTVRSDPFIEGKNSHFQRVLYRIAKTNKTRDLAKLAKLAQTQMNRTQSSLTKQTPIDNAKSGTKDLATKYNKKRGKDSGVKLRRRPLVPGEDRVRVQLLFKKDQKVGFKAYKGATWSKRRYIVQTKRGNRYKVNNKMYHRDELRLTEEYDTESESLVESRK